MRGKKKKTHLWTFSGHALSFQPALDAGEAEEMSAAQSGQPVFARRRPRLEADGADVAFALFGLRRLKRSRARGDRLQVDRRTGSGYKDTKTSNYRFKMRCANFTWTTFWFLASVLSPSAAELESEKDE